MGNRKIKLLFDIPSSDDVFYMQSIGERCITAFIQEHELSRLLKDHYPPFEERDALSFLLHDIQHMVPFLISFISFSFFLSFYEIKL